MRQPARAAPHRLKESEETESVVTLPSVDAGNAFDDWYRAEHGRVVAVLVRLGADGETAADVAAEAFSRALERWGRVGAMGSPTGWTVQVACNLLRRRGRRAALERTLLGRRAMADGSTGVAGDGVGGPGGEVWDAVRRLPDRQRRAVVLHYLFDLPYAEVAHVMGITMGTVGSTLAAARGRLAEVLGDA